MMSNTLEAPETALQRPGWYRELFGATLHYFSDTGFLCGRLAGRVQRNLSGGPLGKHDHFTEPTGLKRERHCQACLGRLPQ